MSFASFNADGDLKHLAEFIGKVIIGFGIVVALFIVLALWLFVSSRAKRKREKAEADEAMSIVDEMTNNTSNKT